MSGEQERDDRDDVRALLPEEHPLHIALRNTRVATLLCTRERLEDLAAGWCFAQGIPIRATTEIELADTVTETVANVDHPLVGEFAWHGFVSSGFDAGSLRAVVPDPLSEASMMDEHAFEKQVRHVFDMFRELRGAGGYHHAALMGETAVHSVLLDLSRHNAVDKVVGDAIRRGLDVSRSAIVLSGRVSADIAVKGARIGVPIIASRSLPTAQAVAIAERAGLMLVCRVLDHRRVTFGRPRITGPDMQHG